ncbi:MAG: hypothetical protein R3175_06615 [Marinobacter sp.]|uniref:hypothetical protein n=1 Tax=Marinobacter sp. TaxID=50741 RepID=UPI00299D07EA|nr:hypothetical protein [Marinobacter sp.]MDX1755712.1 hypothetical protein [Marinobacter sp.]
MANTDHPKNTDHPNNAYPEFLMPAMPPLGLITALETRVRHWRNRRLLRRLLEYEDFLLEDIGHRRSDLLRASRLPLRVDAVAKLIEWREQRSKGGRNS